MKLPDCFQPVNYTRVVAKTKVGIWMDAEIASQLDAMADRFDGLKGDLVGAALRMFLDADAATQRAALKGGHVGQGGPALRCLRPQASCGGGQDAEAVT
jgi:hypothetical protein